MIERSTFLIKIIGTKTLTGQSPVLFVRHLRMEKSTYNAFG